MVVLRFILENLQGVGLLLIILIAPIASYELIVTYFNIGWEYRRRFWLVVLTSILIITIIGILQNMYKVI